MGQNRSEPQRRLGAVSTTLLVVANMIGTGVFVTSGFLLVDLVSPLAVLIAWLVGGLLALCGALAYGELVAAYPHNGGEYQLIRRIYHPVGGFLAGWISFTVGFSAPIAASALAFGHYLSALAPSVPAVGAAVALVIVLSMFHALHVAAGSALQNILTIIKVLLIIVFIAGGIIYGDLGRAVSTEGMGTLSTVFSPAFAIGLIFITFAYSGWNGAAYLAGEVKNPKKVLPTALIAGTVLVCLLYLGLNAAFFAAAPVGELAGVVEIGHVAAGKLFGERAGAFLSGGIALALASSVSAMIMAGPRVYHALGVDSRHLRFLTYRTRNGGPATAVVLQALVAILMVVTATFETLLSYIGFTLSLSAGATVLGVIVLRRKQPALERPYRTLGYPVTPLLFLVLTSWMVIHTVANRPIVTLWGLATLGLGLLLYLLLGNRTGRLANGRKNHRDLLQP